MYKGIFLIYHNKFTDFSLTWSTAASLIGPTPLHFAARCGALDMVSCLIHKEANVFAADHDGWAPIHHAAFFDHQVIVRYMVRSNSDLLNLPTKNE
jgi:ankyrin repeat protein